MDEAEVAHKKYINVLVGSLEPPNDTYLIECPPFESCSSANSCRVLHTVNDIFLQSGTKGKEFALLSNYAACCMFLPVRR